MHLNRTKPLALVALATALGLLLPAAASAQEGLSYSAVFRATDGQTFDGCVTFDNSSPGTLKVTGHGGPDTLTWSHTNRNNHPHKFHAVGKSGQILISLSGKTRFGDAGIKGDVIMKKRQTGETIILKFTGTSVSPPCN